MDSLLRESRVQPPPEAIDVEAPQKETDKIKILRLIHLVLLVVFAITWVINFIFVGWFYAYAIILVYAWFYTFFSAIFVIGRHSQRYNAFKKFKYLIPTLYGTQAGAYALSLAFFIVGCVYLNKYPDMDPFEHIDDYLKYRASRYMIILSVTFSLMSTSFTAYIREYNAVHIDGIKVEVYEDEETSSSANSDE